MGKISQTDIAMTLPFHAAKTRLPTPTFNLVLRSRLLAARDTHPTPNIKVMVVTAAVAYVLKMGSLR